MKPRLLPLLGAMSVMAACTAPTQTAAPAPGMASIPFVREINQWQPDANKGLYIQLDNHQWYYATFMSPCFELQYAMKIGFRTQPPFSLDKFDSVLVEGRPCYFKSLDPSSGPPGTKPGAPL
jgi:hypothetical protein